MRGGAGRMGEEEVSLALSGMSSGDYVFQDSINLSTSSLFKGRGDFPSRRCLAEWLVKIRIRFLLLLPSPLLPSLLSLSLSPRLLFSSFPSVPFSTSPVPSRFTSPPVATVFCFPCILHVGPLFTAWRRVNIQDSRRRCIHWKLADLDREEDVEEKSTNFRRATATRTLPAICA